MSMIGNFALAPAARIEELLDDPSEILAYLHGDDASPIRLDIDKAWHGLHYLFTCKAGEGDALLSFILAGGQEIGDEDLGYGPGRAFMPPEVKRIAAALEKLSPDELRRRYNPAEMMELGIYPAIWDRPPDEDYDGLSYLLDYFGMLKSFLRKGAEGGLGLIVYVG